MIIITNTQLAIIKCSKVHNTIRAETNPNHFKILWPTQSEALLNKIPWQNDYYYGERRKNHMGSIIFDQSSNKKYDTV